MRAAVTVGCGLAFLAQGVAAVGLGAGWAGAFDVSGGGCSYDGTCSDQGSLALAVLVFMIMLGAEGAAGSVLAWVAWRRRRRANDLLSASGTTAGTDFVGLLAERAARAVLAGCIVAWLLLIQASVIDHRAAAQHPGSDAAQGSFFITWNGRAMVLEILVAMLMAAIYARWRRMRARGDG